MSTPVQSDYFSYPINHLRTGMLEVGGYFKDITLTYNHHANQHMAAPRVWMQAEQLFLNLTVLFFFFGDLFLDTFGIFGEPGLTKSDKKGLDKP